MSCLSIVKYFLINPHFKRCFSCKILVLSTCSWANLMLWIWDPNPISNFLSDPTTVCHLREAVQGKRERPKYTRCLQSTGQTLLKCLEARGAAAVFGRDLLRQESNPADSSLPLSWLSLVSSKFLPMQQVFIIMLYQNVLVKFYREL